MRLSFYTDIGKRELNEDYITYRENIYVLCDGVGGAQHGEVASRFVAEKMAEYIEKEIFNAVSNSSSIQDVLKKIQIELNERLTFFPDENGMGTTLAAILINKGHAYAIHIGDSRIYYVRPSERSFWCSTDHSVVSELISSGIITEDEARNHPMKNRITRAIQSNFEMKTTKAEINCFSEIEVGDLIFICSDGVLESISGNVLLETLYDQNYTIDEKIDKVRYACKG